MMKIKKLIYFVSVIILMGAIFYFSTAPIIEVEGVGINAGFLTHLATYFLLSFLIYKTTSSFRIAILLAGTYGLLIEFIQLSFPYRTFDFLDMLINFVGSSLILLGKLLRS